MVKKIYSFYPIDLINYYNLFNEERKKLNLDIEEDIINEKNFILSIQSKKDILFSKNKFKKIKIGQIDTLNLIENSIEDIIQNNSIDSNSFELICNLQKKFEIFNKLYSNYNVLSFTKSTSKKASIRVYLLLNILFIIFYLKGKGINFFNTSLKLMDFLLQKEGFDLMNYKQIISLSFSLEKIALNKIQSNF